MKKKRAKKVDYSDVTSKDNSEFSERAKKRSARDKKPVVQEDIGYVEKDKLKGGKNPLLMDIARKCEKAFQKIKKHPLADYFVNPVKPDAPSLSQIEKAIKSLTYTNLYQFGLDLRKLWTFHFSTSTGNGEIFQRTCKMSEFSEEVIKELENAPEEKSDIHELSKKVEKLTKEVKEISFKGGQPTTQNVTKKPEKGGSILDKPMSNAEKNNLGNSIRNLTPDQLKGIVNILSDSLVIDAQSRFFEFDIETLSTRKLRELEKYVKQCLKGKTGQPKTEANVTKKPPVQHPTGEMSENDRVAQLKNDLAFNKNGNVGSRVGTVQTKLQTNSNIGQQQTQHKRPSQNREIKNVLSESDESLSSSDESGNIFN